MPDIQALIAIGDGRHQHQAHRAPIARGSDVPLDALERAMAEAAEIH